MTRRRHRMSEQKKQYRSNQRFVHHDLPKVSRAVSRTLNSSNYRNSDYTPSDGPGFWSSLINICNAIQTLAWGLVSAMFMLGGLVIMLAFFWAIAQAL